jgi:hypothetical protein
MSTTGATLFQKNIGFDVSPETGIIEGEIASIVSSPNPEDMHVIILTRHGKILKYPIRLERLIDPSKPPIEEELNETNHTNMTSKKKPREKLLYEYVISEPKIYDANQLFHTEASQYSHMICFHTKGELLLVFVQDGRSVVSFDPYKNKTSRIEMEEGGIQGIERWSAFVYVLYENHIEFIQFDKK